MFLHNSFGRQSTFSQCKTHSTLRAAVGAKGLQKLPAMPLPMCVTVREFFSPSSSLCSAREHHCTRRRHDPPPLQLSSRWRPALWRRLPSSPTLLAPLPQSDFSSPTPTTSLPGSAAGWGARFRSVGSRAAEENPTTSTTTPRRNGTWVWALAGRPDGSR